MTDGFQVALSDKSLRAFCEDLVFQSGANGVTTLEACAITGRHHGHVSAVFSTMHKKGKVARLEEERNGYQPYVHPDAVYGRPTVAQGWGGRTKEEIEWACSLMDVMEYWFEVDLASSRFGTERERVDLPGNRPLFVKQIREVWGRRPL